MLPNITRSFLATAFTALLISTTAAVADNTEEDRERYERHAHKKHHHSGSSLNVDCDHGQTLTAALQIAKPGSTIGLI